MYQKQTRPFLSSWPAIRTSLRVCPDEGWTYQVKKQTFRSNSPPRFSVLKEEDSGLTRSGLVPTSPQRGIEAIGCLRIYGPETGRAQNSELWSECKQRQLGSETRQRGRPCARFLSLCVCLRKNKTSDRREEWADAGARAGLFWRRMKEKSYTIRPRSLPTCWQLGSNAKLPMRVRSRFTRPTL